MIVKVSWCVDGYPPGVTWEPVDEDACHFYLVPRRVLLPGIRVPHRNVYVMNMVAEPQDHKNAISDYIRRDI
jgi:hypothetical protein